MPLKIQNQWPIELLLTDFKKEIEKKKTAQAVKMQDPESWSSELCSGENQ